MKNLIWVVIAAAIVVVGYFTVVPKMSKDAQQGLESVPEASDTADTSATEDAPIEVVAGDAAETVTETVMQQAETMVEEVTDQAAESVEQAQEIVSDVVEESVEVVAETSETLSETATGASETAAEMADVQNLFTSDGFEMSQVVDLIDASELDVLKKTALKSALETAAQNPEGLAQVLIQTKTALGF